MSRTPAGSWSAGSDRASSCDSPGQCPRLCNHQKRHPRGRRDNSLSTLARLVSPDRPGTRNTPRRPRVVSSHLFLTVEVETNSCCGGQPQKECRHSAAGRVGDSQCLGSTTILTPWVAPCSFQRLTLGVFNDHRSPPRGTSRVNPAGVSAAGKNPRASPINASTFGRSLDVFEKGK